MRIIGFLFVSILTSSAFADCPSLEFLQQKIVEEVNKVELELESAQLSLKEVTKDKVNILYEIQEHQMSFIYKLKYLLDDTEITDEMDELMKQTSDLSINTVEVYIEAQELFLSALQERYLKIEHQVNEFCVK